MSPKSRLLVCTIFACAAVLPMFIFILSFNRDNLTGYLVMLVLITTGIWAVKYFFWPKIAQIINRLAIGWHLLVGLLLLLIVLLTVVLGGVRSQDDFLFLWLYVLMPAVCAFAVTYFLADKINYDPNGPTHGLLTSLLVSLLIVVASMLLWTLPAMLYTGFDEFKAVFSVVLMAGSYLGWATYPPGLLAGYICWRIAKKRYLSSHANAAVQLG